MAGNDTSMMYSILLTRAGDRCLASIPELCVAEAGSDPQEALAAALRAESDVREALEAAGTPLPPSGRSLDPLPGVTRAAVGFLDFFKKLLVGYVLVVCITAVLLVLVLPSLRSRAEQYLNGTEITADAGKVFSRLGVAVCSERR